MNNNIKLFFLITVSFCGVVIGAGCQKDEYVQTTKVKPEKRIQDFFPGGAAGGVRPDVIKLDKDTVYILDSDITIEDGEQLIIEEGTTIKAGVRSVSNPAQNNPGQGSLIIRRGGALIANGTASEPIVFTSNTVAGTQGLNWGGLTIEGKSVDNDMLPGSADPTDFSGTLRFCRVEFAPLTLRAVGSRTIIENVMVSYVNKNGVSSFNIYGGTFNAYRLISYAANGPADYLITNGYSGRMQYVVAYRHPFFGETGYTPGNSLTGIYIDNNMNNPRDARPYTFPVISNLTILGPSDQNGLTPTYTDTTIRAAAIITSNNTYFAIRNSAFLGCLRTIWIIDDGFTAEAIRDNQSDFSNSYFHAVDTSRPFNLKPGVLGQFDDNDLKRYMLSPNLNNKLLSNITQLAFQDVYSYGPALPIPAANSVLQGGADFSGLFADASVFTKVSFTGAVGTEDWTKNWTNFQPLKTNYNFPK